MSNNDVLTMQNKPAPPKRTRAAKAVPFEGIIKQVLVISLEAKIALYNEIKLMIEAEKKSLE